MRYVLVFIALFVLVVAFFVGYRTDVTTLLVIASAMLGTILGAMITAGACALAGGFRSPANRTYGDEKPIVIVQPSVVEPEKPRFRYPTEFIPRDQARIERPAGKRRGVYVVGDE